MSLLEWDRRYVPLVERLCSVDPSELVDLDGGDDPIRGWPSRADDSVRASVQIQYPLQRVVAGASSGFPRSLYTGKLYWAVLGSIVVR
jgi:hypothetical protein